MSPEIPPPLRAAAGLAALTLEEARRLPRRVVTLPVLAVGAAMQASLRLQQEYAGLVARGDEILTYLRGQGDDIPAWAQFDEDAPAPGRAEDLQTGAWLAETPSSFDLVVDPPDLTVDVDVSDIAVDLSDTAVDLAPGLGPDGDPVVDLPEVPRIGIPRTRPAGLVSPSEPDNAPLPGYDGWTIAQLRARLRNFSPDQLTELLEYERAGLARASYLTMLGNRLAGRRKPAKS